MPFDAAILAMPMGRGPMLDAECPARRALFADIEPAHDAEITPIFRYIGRRRAASFNFSARFAWRYRRRLSRFMRGQLRDAPTPPASLVMPLAAISPPPTPPLIYAIILLFEGRADATPL